MMKQTKRNSRLIALLLIFALLLTTGLFSSCQTTEPPEGEDTTDAETTGGETETPTQEVVGGKYAKRPNTATLDDDFYPDFVIVGIQPYAIGYEYTVESFSEVGCIGITDYQFPADVEGGVQKRHLALEFSGVTKEDILEVMDILLMRDDIWYTAPNYARYPYDDGGDGGASASRTAGSLLIVLPHGRDVSQADGGERADIDTYRKGICFLFVHASSFCAM